MGFPVASFESGQRYRPSPGDLFVVSYPKCGTTWTQYIVYLLEHEGRPLAASQRLDEVFPHLEEVGEAAVRGLREPRLVKTHLPFSRTPWSAQAKYIYVARNPFDCAVSFYHHTRGFERHYDFAAGSWDTFFEWFVRGEVDFGDYFDNLLSWWPRRSEQNVLFLTYERMLEAPAAAVQRIGAFLGGRAAELARDARRLEGVVRASGFEQMRRGQERWSSARPAEMPAFVRKGVAGDWRNHFSAEQARRLAEKFRARAAGAAIEDLWPGLVANALEWSLREKPMTTKLTEPQEIELEAAVLRRLLRHFDEHKEVQNIELMTLAGFCRNCLSKWFVEAAKERNLDVDLDSAREKIYGMPYSQWKDRYQPPATEEQLARLAAAEKAKKTTAK